MEPIGHHHGDRFQAHRSTEPALLHILCTVMCCWFHLSFAQVGLLAVPDGSLSPLRRKENPKFESRNSNFELSSRKGSSRPPPRAGARVSGTILSHAVWIPAPDQVRGRLCAGMTESSSTPRLPVRMDISCGVLILLESPSVIGVIPRSAQVPRPQSYVRHARGETISRLRPWDRVLLSKITKDA